MFNYCKRFTFKPRFSKHRGKKCIILILCHSKHRRQTAVFSHGYHSPPPPARHRGLLQRWTYYFGEKKIKQKTIYIYIQNKKIRTKRLKKGIQSLVFDTEKKLQMRHLQNFCYLCTLSDGKITVCFFIIFCLYICLINDKDEFQIYHIKNYLKQSCFRI